jgi:hypothetical protein
MPIHVIESELLWLLANGFRYENRVRTEALLRLRMVLMSL